MPHSDKDRSLVRGVSNHGAAPSLETGATRGTIVESTWACALLRTRRRTGLNNARNGPADQDRRTAVPARCDKGSRPVAGKPFFVRGVGTTETGGPSG